MTQSGPPSWTWWCCLFSTVIIRHISKKEKRYSSLENASQFQYFNFSMHHDAMKSVFVIFSDYVEAFHSVLYVCWAGPERKKILLTKMRTGGPGNPTEEAKDEEKTGPVSKLSFSGCFVVVLQVERGWEQEPRFQTAFPDLNCDPPVFSESLQKSFLEREGVVSYDQA